MFGNLIESGSHTADLKRKSRFFIGTMLFYGMLLLGTGVGSIYAYNAHLEERGDEYELLAIMRFAPADRSEQRREAARPATNRGNKIEVAVRANAAVQTPYNGDRIAPESSRDIPAGVRFIDGLKDSGALVIGDHIDPVGPDGTGNNPGGTIGPLVKDTEGDVAPPVAVKPKPAPVPEKPTAPVRLTSSVLTGKVVQKPAPAYPTLAKQMGIQGAVSVNILIDEQGRVVSAKAMSGHPMLQVAAQQAALRASFSPTKLSGQPVKVTGVITYNFVLQ